MDIKENKTENNNADKHSINSKNSIYSIKSTNKLSKKDNAKSVQQVVDIDSEDISLSQLELMANKKKLNKQVENSVILSNLEMDIKKPSTKKSKTSSSSSSSSSSISSSSSDSTKKKLRRERAIQKENRDDEIRKEKSELLFKFNKLNVKGKWSSLRLDMNNSLDEIRNEHERVRNEIQTERSVAFFKRMLLLGVQGIEMLNNRFDPLGVDLDGWSEAMGYSMENQEYDEVMAELYEKYKGRGQMSPEMKLIFMIISSATMFTISKKITKMDGSNPFASLIGNLVGNKAPENYVQQDPRYVQQDTRYPQYEMESSRRDLRTETTEDPMPSKIKDPGNFGNEIDDILKTMKQRKMEKQNLQEVTETSDDILKNIPLAQKRGRGRPKKGNNTVKLF